MPIRLFEVCIDLLFKLSSENMELPESTLKRAQDAKDEVYGLLMGFE